MKQIPTYMYNEIMAVTKVLAEHHPPNSLKHINAIRRAAIIYRKLDRRNRRSDDKKNEPQA